MILTDKFRKDLQAVLNSHNIDSMTNTPDFILVVYLCQALESYNQLQNMLKRIVKS